MQFWQIDETTKLTELTQLVGSRNVDQVLHYNGLARTPDIGKAYSKLCEDAINELPDNIGWQRKSSLLSAFVGDSDVFETAALASESTWKLLSSKNTFPMCIKFPELIPVPDSSRILGNKQGVSANIYKKTLECLSNIPHTVDPNIFNEYSSTRASNLIFSGSSKDYTASVFEWAKLPWGDIRLYSNLDDDYVDFPVYPESVSDGRKANYNEMPELIYQYEPWYIYHSSGPRVCNYSFDFHRDMWNGDHNKGGANQLIRFCEAQCYPSYHGSAVNTATVTLYVKGQILITGVLTDVQVEWDGPIGHDGWYLHCKLTLTINEVSNRALNHNVVKNLGVIG